MISLAFRTVTGRQFSLDVPKSSDILAVKKLFEEKFHLSAENLKLFYLSAILLDDHPVEQLNMPVGSYILVHQSNQHIVREKPERKAKEKPKVRDDPPDFDVRVEMLSSMGFERSRCEQALRDANYNPDVAANLLLGSPIPEPSPPPAPRSPGSDRAEVQAVIDALSSSDRAAVDRIAARGFSLEDAVQVYLACGKCETTTLACLNSMR